MLAPDTNMRTAQSITSWPPADTAMQRNGRDQRHLRGALTATKVPLLCFSTGITWGSPDREARIDLTGPSHRDRASNHQGS